MNKAKVGPKTVQSILRHSRIQTTLDIYTQGDGDETRAAQGDGERDPHELAAYRNARVEASEDEIAQSLEGNWQEDQLFVLRQEQAGYEFCQKQTAECDRQLAQYLGQMEDRSQGAILPNETRKGRRKKKKGSAPQFDLREGLFRMTGTDLTQIERVDRGESLRDSDWGVAQNDNSGIGRSAMSLSIPESSEARIPEPQ